MYDHERADRLAHYMLKKVNRAVRDYGMIEDRDRIAVALSGGKDSFSLLRILQYRQRFTPERYQLVAVHVIGDARGPEIPPHPELEDWLRANEIEYLIRPTHISENEEIPVPCERCSWNRRHTLFEMAWELGCNKVAYGHHMDDFAETILMNLFHQGRLESMSPCAEYFGGKFRIIRPLMYVPEREIKRFASAHDFPPPPSPCPQGDCTERKRMKEMIADLQKTCRGIRTNLLRAALKEMERQLPAGRNSRSSQLNIRVSVNHASDFTGD